MKTRLAALLIFVVLSTAAAVAAVGRRPPASDWAGTYAFSWQFGGGSMTLAGDGAYTSDSGSCTGLTRYHGSWRLEGGVVVVSVESMKTMTYDEARGEGPGGEGERGEAGEPAAEDANEAEAGEAEEADDGEGADEPFKPHTERFVPVRWGERRYLIYETGVEDFCNAVNAGAEPRPAEGDAGYADYHIAFNGSYLGPFFLRAGDEKRPAPGLPEVPGAFRGMLLGKPARAEVLSVDAEGVAFVAVRGRGRLKPGMTLYLQRERPPKWGETSADDSFKVLSVEGTTARVQVGRKARPGDLLSTRFQRPRME